MFINNGNDFCSKTNQAEFLEDVGRQGSHVFFTVVSLLNKFFFLRAIFKWPKPVISETKHKKNHIDFGNCCDFLGL